MGNRFRRHGSNLVWSGWGAVWSAQAHLSNVLFSLFPSCFEIAC
ncbi:hypothetical protein XCR_4013 [Xanthomonas campestris pv. raphani 756C]|nr:hypothetical protein XCR_4013 [Xanthomonas campestris pv. raphani 756C]